MENNENKVIDDLILSGALEVGGVDSKTGELLYVFTPKLKEVNPALYKEHINHVNSELMTLWENGFINIDFMSDTPQVTLTDKAFDKDKISALSQEQQWGIEEVKRLLLSKEL